MSYEYKYVTGENGEVEDSWIVTEDGRSWMYSLYYGKWVEIGERCDGKSDTDSVG